MSSSNNNSIVFSVFGNQFYFTFNFAFAAILVIIIFVNLGFWQLSRAQEKRQELGLFSSRSHENPISFSNLEVNTDWRYYPIQLTGSFDNEHQFLLDNKIKNEQLGYEVITPFKSPSLPQGILVDRGWVGANQNRAELPNIQTITTPLTLQGTLIIPPEYFMIGSLYDENAPWPLIIQHLDISKIAETLDYPLFPYVVLLSSDSPQGFQREWQLSHLDPTKNINYARQWFLLAILVLILFFIINIRRMT